MDHKKIAAMMALLIPSLSVVPGAPWRAASAEQEDPQLRLVESVKAYVLATKGWREDSYSVRVHQMKEDIVVFEVIHEDDKISAIPGGGKSFVLEVDRKTGRVMRELGFE